MEFSLSMIFFFFVFSILFVFLTVFIAKLLRAHFPDKIKETTYECGEKPIGQAWFNFNPRFYIVAIIFVIFEVEIVLTLPVALVFKSWIKADLGLVAFVELIIFLFFLIVGLAYVWAKDDLSWFKKIT